DVQTAALYIAADGDVVSTAVGQHFRTPRVRAIAVGCVLRARQAGGPARKRQRGRPPVRRILIVARDAGVAADAGAIREVRQRVVGETRVLVTQPERRELRETVRVVDRSVDARHVARIEEAEDIATVGGRPLHRYAAEQ